MAFHASRVSISRTGVLITAILGALSGAAGPVLADGRSDGVSCAMGGDHVLKVVIAEGATATVSRTVGGVIKVNGGTCATGSGRPTPDVWNTKRIDLRGFDGGDGKQKVVLDLANGGFAPGFGDEAGTTDEIEMSALLGGANDMDELQILGTPGVDDLTFAWVPGNMVVIPAINLNATDGDYDLTYLSVEYVNAWGGGSGDKMSGTDAAAGRQAFQPLYLHGGIGGDQLTGGAANDNLYGDGGPDTLKGGPGIDELFAEDGVSGNDSLNGGGGSSDSCISDPEDLEVACEFDAID